MTVLVCSPLAHGKWETYRRTAEKGIAMKYGDWNLGQIEALLNKLGGEDVARGILDNTVKFTVTARVRELLRPAGEFTLPTATELFDPHVYFQHRKGLFVWNGFTETVLLVAQRTDGFGETTVGSFDLVKTASSAEIRSELPEDHVFGDPSEFCAVLAHMLDQQPNGERGNLLVNGYWNIFYVRGDVVYVRWNAGDRTWNVDAGPLGSTYRWDEGDRALSYNC